MLGHGVAAEDIDGHGPTLRQWLGAFRDPGRNVIDVDVVEQIRENPLIPRDVPGTA